jgi:hypothetical protein
VVFRVGNLLVNWSPSDEVTAGRLAAMAAVSTSADPATGLELVGGGRAGSGVRDASARSIFGMLSGSTSPYGFTQWTDSGADVFVAGPRSGLAYEVNGVAGLGSRVARLYPDRSGDYRFQSVRHGGAGGGGPVPTCLETVPLSLTWTITYFTYGSPMQSIALTYSPTLGYWVSPVTRIPDPVCPYIYVVGGCGYTGSGYFLAGQVYSLAVATDPPNIPGDLCPGGPNAYLAVNPWVMTSFSNSPFMETFEWVDENTTPASPLGYGTLS